MSCVSQGAGRCFSLIGLRGACTSNNWITKELKINSFSSMVGALSTASQSMPQRSCKNIVLLKFLKLRRITTDGFTLGVRTLYDIYTRSWYENASAGN